MKVHTFEIQTRIKYSEYKKCKDVFYAEAKNKKGLCYGMNQNNLTQYNKWKNEGVIIYINRIAGTGYGAYLKLRVNPSLVVSQKYDALNLFCFEEKATIALLENLSNIIRHLPIEKTITEFSLCRFDLCTDIPLETKAEVIEYIRLLNKGANSADFGKMEYGNEKDAHSYRRLNDRYQISVYDKLYQMNDRNLFSEHMTDERVLRTELSLTAEGISILKRKLELRSDILWTDIALVFCQCGAEIMCSIIDRLTLPDNYYSLAYAKKIISGSHFSKSKQQKIIEYITKLCKADCITCNNLSDKKRMRQLHILGINPAVITYRSGIHKLTSLQDLIYENEGVDID